MSSKWTMRNLLRRFRRYTRFVAGVVAFLLLFPVTSSMTVAQSTNTRAEVPDLSGLWLRMDTTGSGSFKALDDNLPKPELVHPPLTAPLAPPGKAHGPLDPYIVTNGECDTTGAQGLLMMDHPAALDIVQTKNDAVISSEVSNVRFLYLDGRTLPAPGTYDYVPVGYSVGHWDRDVLAVETVGFDAPGKDRGASVMDTHLFERYSLSDGGKRLSVTFTWVNPTIFVKPWTYTYTYQKLPPGSYAFEEWCDSGDPLQTQSIIPPKQN
jgi:hypothetical protein